MQEDDVLLTVDELAARWKIKPHTLNQKRSHGTGMPFLKIDRTIRYRLSDVIAYEKAAEHGGQHV